MNIFFDLDGTLINPLPRLYAIHTNLTKKYNLPNLSYRAYAKYKRRHLPELSWIDAKHKNQKQRYIKKRELLLESTKFLAMDILYPDVIPTLKTLQEKHNLYLLTVRKKRENLINQLQRVGITIFFKKIFSSSGEDSATVKERLLKHSGLPLDKSAVVVGDTEIDIEAGRKTGIQTVVIQNRLRTKEHLLAYNPDYIITNLKSFLPLISKLQKSL